MNFWDFASNHPVALFFCIIAIGWGLNAIFGGNNKGCCSDGCHCKKDA